MIALWWTLGAAMAPEGKISWSVEATAATPGAHDMLALTRAWLGTSLTVSWSGDRRSLTVVDGVGAGTWAVDPAGRRSTYSPVDGGPRQVQVEDLEAASPELRALLPSHYQTALVDTGRTETILGVTAKEMEVKESPFVRGPTTLWIAHDVAMPAMRLQMTTSDAPFVSMTAPLPLSIPIGSGVVLKATTVDQGVRVTWTANACSPCDAITAAVAPP